MSSLPFRAALARLADVCWPRPCAVRSCGRPVDRPGRHVCSACLARLPFHVGGGACRICGRTIPSGAARAFVCEDCARHPPAYDLARSAIRFEPPFDDLIKSFKYGRALWLRPDLADLLEGAVRAKLDAAAVDVVVPVPLHPHRLRSRGYNQSALLARDLSARIGRRCDETSLARVRETGHQARLHASERKNNLAGAFAVTENEFIRRRTVLLVDDVMTTGATLSECAAVLKRAGAVRVWCATVARSVADK